MMAVINKKTRKANKIRAIKVTFSNVFAVIPEIKYHFFHSFSLKSKSFNYILQSLSIIFILSKLCECLLKSSFSSKYCVCHSGSFCRM